MASIIDHDKEKCGSIQDSVRLEGKKNEKEVSGDFEKQAL